MDERQIKILRAPVALTSLPISCVQSLAWLSTTLSSSRAGLQLVYLQAPVPLPMVLLAQHSYLVNPGIICKWMIAPGAWRGQLGQEDHSVWSSLPICKPECLLLLRAGPQLTSYTY